MSKIVRVQRLKEPKKNSGKELAPGAMVKLPGLEIRNTGKKSAYVSEWERKPWKKREVV